MSDKKIVISAGLDTSEFDRKIQDIQRRLGSITGRTDLTGSVSSANQALKQAGYSPITSGQELQHNKNLLTSVKELDTYINKQVQSEGKVLQALENRIKKLNELKKINQEDLKTEKEREEVKAKISKHEESVQRLQGLGRAGAMGVEQSVQTRQQQIAQMSTMEKLKYGYSTGGISGAAGMFGGMGSLAMSGLARASSMAMAVDPAIREYAGMPRQAESYMGAAVRGSSDVAESIYSKKLAQEIYFSKQRSEATQKTKEEMDTIRSMDKVRSGAAIGASAVAAAGGAAMGGGLGSIVPGLGTGVGAFLGGVGAGTSAFFGSTNERQRAMLLSPFSNTAGKFVESSYQQESVQKYQQNLKALKDQQYLDQLAMDRAESTMPRNLQFQRQMGMGNQDFYGNYLKQGFQGGFSEENMMGASQAIMSAGGTTQGSKDLALTSNQFQRNMGLTNASSLLGRLSGAGQTESKEALIKVLSEGMKIGLDTSTYAQESRKFAESVTEIAYRTGAKSESGVGQIANVLGGFTPDLTSRGLSAGQNAFQQFNSMMGAGSGPQNLIRQQYMARQKEMQGFTGAEISYLSQMTPEQIMAGGASVQSAAAKAGVSVEEFQSTMMKGVRSASTLTEGQEKKLEAFSKKYGSPEGQKKLREEVAKGQFKDPELLSLLAGQNITGTGIGAAGSLEELSGILGVSSLGREGADKEAVRKAMQTPSTKIEDQKERAEAKQAQTVNEAMVKMFESMGSAYEKINNATSQQMKDLLNASEKMKTEGKDAIDEYNKAFQALNVTLQEGTGVLKRQSGFDGLLEGLPLIGTPAPK